MDVDTDINIDWWGKEKCAKRIPKRGEGVD